MVLDSKRKQANVILDPAARAFSRFDPNLLSWLSLLLAALAGLVIYLSPSYPLVLLPLVSIIVLLSGFFDALDGKVARLVGKASRKGDFLDHVLDRYADVLIIGGVAVSAWCNPYIGILALVGVLLTSYMGTQAQAIGAGRLYAGLLGRADRLVLLVAAPLVELALLPSGGWIEIGQIHLSAFEIVMLWFGIVGNITAVQRAVKTWKMIS